jgi:hypothetical protein
MNGKQSIENWLGNPIEQGQSYLNEILGRFGTENYMSESEFEKMVILERKKSERSGRSFLLVLVYIDQTRKVDPWTLKKFTRDMSLALDYCTREIDVKGWYVKNAVLGILCPDIDARKKEILTRRLNSTLQSALNKFQELHLKVNGMLYPEADETHGNDFENGVANNKNKEYSLAEGQR